MNRIIHLWISPIVFTCPYCGLVYQDTEEKYLEEANEYGHAVVACQCKNVFAAWYDMTGRWHGDRINLDPEFATQALRLNPAG